MQPLMSQLSFFGLMIGVGAGLGFVIDLYRIGRGLLRPRSFISHLGDLIFWVLVSLGLLAFLVYGNWGVIRMYVVLGITLGLGLYFLILSPTVLVMSVALSRMGRSLGGGVIGVLAAIFILPIRLITSLLGRTSLGRRCLSPGMRRRSMGWWLKYR